jgi:hypothetical protein
LILCIRDRHQRAEIDARPLIPQKVIYANLAFTPVERDEILRAQQRWDRAHPWAARSRRLGAILVLIAIVAATGDGNARLMVSLGVAGMAFMLASRLPDVQAWGRPKPPRVSTDEWLRRWRDY